MPFFRGAGAPLFLVLPPVGCLPPPCAPLSTMISRKIYTSPLPSVHLSDESIFTHLFGSDDPRLVGAFPASHPAFIDAATGTTITRGQLKQLALQFGYGLRTVFGAERGDVHLIYAQNSIHWPVVVFGAGVYVSYVGSFD